MQHSGQSRPIVRKQEKARTAYDCELRRRNGVDSPGTEHVLIRPTHSSNPEGGSFREFSRDPSAHVRHHWWARYWGKSDRSPSRSDMNSSGGVGVGGSRNSGSYGKSFASCLARGGFAAKPATRRGLWPLSQATARFNWLRSAHWRNTRTAPATQGGRYPPRNASTPSPKFR